MSEDKLSVSPLYIFRTIVLKVQSLISATLVALFTPLIEKTIFRTWKRINVKLEGVPEPSDLKIDQNDKSQFASPPQYSKELVMKVKDASFFKNLALEFNLGLAEAYMDKMWECTDVEELLYRIFKMKGKRSMSFAPLKRLQEIAMYATFSLVNMQETYSGTKKVADIHYDLGNDLYESFLGKWMQYTCAYWANSDNLDDAQEAKMELIAQKLKLRPGMRVLDIGCGWGTLCKYLAEKHGVHCVGISISEEGIKYGQEKCKGLPVELKIMDYRNIDEKFDRIVSVGMFEHVGHKNYRKYFEIASKCLTDDGLFLCHTIGTNHGVSYCNDAFYEKYIFPNSALPRHTHITEATDGLFVIEDWHNFGHDYHKTLRAWRSNFIQSWPKLSAVYGDRFYRMWNFYLDLCSALFRARKLQLWQVVLSKGGLEGGYKSVR